MGDNRISMQSTEPSCGNGCPMYRAAKFAAPEKSVVDMRGTCQRFPRAELKRPDEVCGEHPVHVKARELQLATTIATLVCNVDRQISKAAERHERKPMFRR